VSWRQRPLGAQRHRARALGHRAGVGAARASSAPSHSLGVEVLTLFAFSQETGSGRRWKCAC